MHLIVFQTHDLQSSGTITRLWGWCIGPPFVWLVLLYCTNHRLHITVPIIERRNGCRIPELKFKYTELLQDGNSLCVALNQHNFMRALCFLAYSKYDFNFGIFLQQFSSEVFLIFNLLISQSKLLGLYVVMMI